MICDVRSRDVSEEIAYDVLDRAYDADTTLSVGAKRFIDRHVTSGAKRPSAPSVRREPDQSARKKAWNRDRREFRGAARIAEMMKMHWHEVIEDLGWAIAISMMVTIAIKYVAALL
jgi:hypothetical protein